MVLNEIFKVPIVLHEVGGEPVEEFAVWTGISLCTPKSSVRFDKPDAKEIPARGGSR